CTSRAYLHWGLDSW
nr:immunoglobulin heavy chain junction region [Macaca mulatta]MOY22313.1 immunoglobulin heavy chain junction region [Macaca mulatta]MOY22394.1 immunoglobulin heavy chain junction region [Macaca mulatta]MOY22420.1 immunoglobulin heavy chain junction region [Macaca mulatta]MOY23219.1 immunoglobulin heavy chain junction region [Macaca mulatta]